MLNVKIPNETDRKLGKHFLEPQYNMINKTILNEYNQLFDEIMAIEIQDIVHEKNDNQSSKEVLKKYTFSEGLCARRLKKCSVEGGVMRAKKLQEKFLAHQVNINENDDKKTSSCANNSINHSWISPSRSIITVFNTSVRI